VSSGSISAVRRGRSSTPSEGTSPVQVGDAEQVQFGDARFNRTLPHRVTGIPRPNRPAMDRVTDALRP
jgi:hypothetical protein